MKRVWILFVFVLYILNCNVNVVSARSYDLKKGEVTQVEIDSKIDEFQIITIPSGYCYYRIEITDIQVWVAGEQHQEYVKHVYVDDLYDTGEEHYASNGVISFKKDGRGPGSDRGFLLLLDTDRSHPELYGMVEYIVKCNVRVSADSEAKLSKTNVSCYLGDLMGVTVKLNNASDKVAWSISNKKIATVSKEDNYATVYPKTPGTCYLKAKCDGKTYKCKIQVKGRKYVYAGGYLMSYDTRTNTFRMKFKNCSNKAIRIRSSDAIAVDSDYTAYDRKVKLARTVSVKPGKVKILAFKVVGSITWNNVDDFCINYTISFNGKKYRMASDHDTTWIRKKGKWKELLTFDSIGTF